MVLPPGTPKLRGFVGGTARPHALAAYQGGYISLGRLARAMRMQVLQMRHWLDQQGIPQHGAHGDEGAARA